MDIELTMEVVVEHLAAVDVRLESLAASQAKTDRQIRGLQTIVKTGMRLIIRLEKNVAIIATAQKELAAAQKELATQQKRTDQKFERWLDSLNRGSNGHKKRSN
jgi:hypothetical protein